MHKAVLTVAATVLGAGLIAGPALAQSGAATLSPGGQPSGAFNKTLPQPASK